MPDLRQPRALLLLAWALGVWTLLTGLTSGRLTHVVAGGALVVLSILTLTDRGHGRSPGDATA